MRYVRYAFFGLLAVALIVTALANRAPVTLNVLPQETGDLLGVSFAITLPLFLVIFASIVAGLLIGFVWEWLREHKHRAAAARERRQKERLAREVDRLRDKSPDEKDDVLALLEGGSKSR